MILGFTPDQVREAERPLLTSGVPLMQRAAAALAARTAPLLREEAAGTPGRRLVILVGAGSNGGDALFAGARLARQGAAVTALRTADRVHEEGERALRQAGGRIVPEATGRGFDQAARTLRRAHVILDGVLGIGGRAELAPDLRRLLSAANDAPAPIVAVDVPTGIDAATGRADEGAVRAHLTVTFGAAKAGLLLPGAAEHVGRLEVADIGLTDHLPASPAVRRLEDEDVRARWPVPGREAQKYSRGVVAIDAGSSAYPGAGILSSLGAAHAGAGMVRYRGPQAVLHMVLSVRPEIVGGDGHHQAVVIGSGLPPEDERCRRGVDELAADGVGVLDAGALGAIDEEDSFGPRVVLTPHAGEARRLAESLGIDPDQDPAPLATAISRACGATVLLKGATTLVAPGDAPEQLFAQADGTAWLGTAGTGDVLGGILGTLLAAGLPGGEAAALAALVHGRAGVLASRGGIAPLVAAEVAGHVPEALAAILGGAARPGDGLDPGRPSSTSGAA